MDINIAEGEWLDKSYTSIVRPILTTAGVSFAKYEVLPLTQLHNNEYWAGLQSNPAEIAILDHRHWFFSDDDFLKYAHRISAVPFGSLCLFEDPFGYERPLQMSLKDFERKLYERTKTIVSIVKSRQQTTILSPAIRVLQSPESQERYLEYFIHARSQFDAYAVHCCTHTTDHSLGALTGFLNQVLKVLNKPVWVTRWSVPSCGFNISSTRMINPTSWQPVPYEMAATKLKSSYEIINEISHGNTKWFFVGAGRDDFHPDKTPPSPYWDSNAFSSNVTNDIWGPEHFVGLLDHRSHLKRPVLNALLQLTNES